jgi:uncharacterized protein YcnI
MFGAAPAWAHVEVHADNPVPGSTSILNFEVPNESETGALTTQFSVVFPNVASASTELMPGWTAKLDRDAKSGTVRSVTWTAAPTVGIAPDQFALFRVDVTLPQSATVSFPATQTYSDGTVVAWNQPPLPGGGEPEHPAPELTLSAGQPASPSPTAAPAQAPAAAAAQAPSSADNTARWLAGGALIVAAVGVALAVLARRRS